MVRRVQARSEVWLDDMMTVCFYGNGGWWYAFAGALSVFDSCL